MLHGISRIIRGGAAVCRHTAAGVQSNRRFSATPCCANPEPRDYALPNPTWTPDTKRMYEELNRDRTWKRLPSYNCVTHHQDGMIPEADKKTRFFTRNLDQDGVGLEYCMFYNKAEKRTICIFQPGPYTEGPQGYTHGGCTAAIIDETLGSAIEYNGVPPITANLSIDYRNPIPLGSTVLIESRVEKVDGRKVYISCQVRSHDGAVLHNEAKGLFLMPKLGEPKGKL